MRIFMKRLNKVIFQAFFPILMFNNLYSIPEGMTLNLRLVAVAIISVLFLQAVLLAVVPRLVKENERRGVIIRRFTAAISSCSAFRWQPACSVRRNTAGDDDGGDRDSGLQHNGGRDSGIVPGRQGPVSVLIKNILKNPMIRGALTGLYLPYVRD